jgi:LysM repeat protein
MIRRSNNVNDLSHPRRCRPAWPIALVLAALISLLLAMPARAQGQVYVVKPGDTLASIAQAHETNVASLLRANNLSDPNFIRAGQRISLPRATQKPLAPGIVPETVVAPGSDPAPALVMPETPTRVYVVQPGDSLEFVALRFKTTTAALAELNMRSPSARLHAGEPLRVPDVEDLVFNTIQTDDIPVPGKYVLHTVQEGESVAAITEAYGTSLRRTLKLNNIENPAAVKPGTRIVVPPPSFAEILADTPIGKDGYPIYPVVPTHGKWISVDLDHQRGWAWEGNTMVKSFWISSGRARTPTVTGVFRIWAKTPSQVMQGGSYETGDYYYLPNVQWVQYFYKEYAIHGAYWHNKFGTPTSRGCVNLTNSDAKWLYEWAEPVIQEHKWHVIDPMSEEATLVVVYQ